MSTLNEQLRDLSLLRATRVRRYSNGLVKQVLRLLDQADQDLVKQIRGGVKPDLIARDIAQLKLLLRTDAHNLAKLEAQREVGNLAIVAPTIVAGLPTAETLRAIVTQQPFQGRLLRQWMARLEAQDLDRIRTAMRIGMTLGESIDDIVARVVGRRSNRYADGVTATTRNQATAIIRTAINHVSNAARAAVWDANSELFTARIWVSTLDGRTSAICRANDGRGIPTVPGGKLPAGLKPRKPPGLVPPAHINCRSVEVAYLGNPEAIGERASAMGPVPASMDYDSWLRSQTTKVQNEILGEKRAKLFRNGLHMSRFVDRRGTELTLTQLSEL